MGEHDDRKQRITDLFGEVMDRGKASELTSLLVPMPWEDLARRSDLERLGTELRSEMSGLKVELKGEVADVRKEVGDLRKEVGDLRVELHDGFASLRGEVDGLKGQLPRLIAANVVSMVGVAGLVLAAGAI